MAVTTMAAFEAGQTSVAPNGSSHGGDDRARLPFSRLVAL
jgi:hypothetical protein